jgi:hypothetical protein
MRSLSPSKACRTGGPDKRALADADADADVALPAETMLAALTLAAPAPVALAAAFGPAGDLNRVSARGGWAFSMLADGATGFSPATPVADAAMRVP